MKTTVAALLLASALAACATAPLTADETSRTQQVATTVRPPATLTGAFVVTDQRNPDATRVRPVPIGLAGGFSCFVGITQLGDTAFAADRVARLENALAQAFPGHTGEPLVVRRYDIFLNRGAEADAAAWGAAMGSVGVFGASGTPGNNAPQIWRRPKCGPDRMHSGWFDQSDLTNNRPPITIDIDVTVFGRDYVVNAARSPELDLDRLGVMHLEESQAFSAMLQQTMDFADARLVAAVRANQPAPTQDPPATP